MSLQDHFEQIAKQEMERRTREIADIQNKLHYIQSYILADYELTIIRAIVDVIQDIANYLTENSKNE